MRVCVIAASVGMQTQIRPAVTSAAPHRRILGWLYVRSGLLLVLNRTILPIMLKTGALYKVSTWCTFRESAQSIDSAYPQMRSSHLHKTNCEDQNDSHLSLDICLQAPNGLDRDQ